MQARKKTSHVASKLNPFFGVHTTAHSHVGMGMEMEWRALGFKASESLAGGLHMVWRWSGRHARLRLQPRHDPFCSGLHSPDGHRAVPFLGQAKTPCLAHNN